MEALGFRHRPLAPGVLQLTGPLGCCATLVLGTRGALLFDVMSGIGDLRGYVESLTPLPLTVVCSHGHFDHAGGCYQFDEVWLSPEEYPLTQALREPDKRRELMEKISRSVQLPPALREQLEAGVFDRYLPLEAGGRFDLGGITAEAVALPGHTPGSMGLLLPEVGLLLSGDAMTPVMCLFFPESLPLEV